MVNLHYGTELTFNFRNNTNGYFSPPSPNSHTRPCMSTYDTITIQTAWARELRFILAFTVQPEFLLPSFFFPSFHLFSWLLLCYYSGPHPFSYCYLDGGVIYHGPTWTTHIIWVGTIGKFVHIHSFIFFGFLPFFVFTFVSDVNAPSCIPQIILQSQRFMPKLLLFAALCEFHQLGPGDPHSRQIFKCNPGSEYIQCQSNTEDDVLSIISQTADDGRIFW